MIDLNYVFKKNIENIDLSDYSSFVLGVDIGGTNTSLGVAGIKETSLDLLYSMKFQTNDLLSLEPAILQIINYSKENYDITIKNTCIGAAGIVSPDMDYVKLTNANWEINTKELIEKTTLDTAFIINDFEAIGYGINLINPNNSEEVNVIRSAKNEKVGKTKAVIGAGTGLGKSILYYNEKLKIYEPIPCEGGHADFPIRNNFELDLINFIKNLRKITEPITNEELVSGRGLENIYRFLKESKEFGDSQYSMEIDNSTDIAETISKYKKVDDLCAETFKWFTKFYSRCAKNFVLDSLATGGLYIAGGIAQKNQEIFSTDVFLNEFNDVYRYSKYLEETPIYIILDYNISLKGACFAAMCKS
jgi:glucokinase